MTIARSGRDGPVRLGRRGVWSTRRAPIPPEGDEYTRSKNTLMAPHSVRGWEPAIHIEEHHQLCVLLGGPFDGRKTSLHDSCKELKVYHRDDITLGAEVYRRFGTMLIHQLKVDEQAGD